MSEKVYCGSGKEFGEYGNMALTVFLDDLKPHIKDLNGKKVLNLVLKKKRNPQEGKPTHYLEVNTWEPKERNDF